MEASMFEQARRGYALAVVHRHLGQRASRGLKRTLNSQRLFHTRKPNALKAARYIAESHSYEVERVEVSRVRRQPFATVFANKLVYADCEVVP